MTVTVLIADDQKVVRDGLAMMLGLLDDIEVVGTAVDGADAIRQAATADPDVILMDLNMPVTDGVEATRRLTAAGSRARVVVLTTYADDDSVFRALHAGARGYLTKDAGAEEIREALLTVAAGEAQLDPSVQRRLLETLAAGARLAVAPASADSLTQRDSITRRDSLTQRDSLTRRDSLTQREEDVLREIAGGHTNQEIAARLHVSEATVKTHINHLLAKTTCRDRAALVAYAFRTGRAH
ncbi:response regulator [Symbioplanes lichenis]|uniref:response regulator n=1 Tax=Symbioplanes lichenis TaxID=1629072 RepID=UPI00273A18D6|nr:response regulator transcription factor [Actinoplanes lichenis]